MKKLITLLKICFVISFALCLAIFGFCNLRLTKTNMNDSSSAITVGEDYSIFINSPTYSTIFNNKIYFLDDYDKLLKIYDLTEEKFSDQYVSLESCGTIEDITYLNGNMFVLTSNNESNQILIINLSTLNIKTISDEKLSLTHAKISATQINDSGTDLFAISVAPTQITNEISPIVVLVNAQTYELNCACEIKFDGGDFEDIKSNLFKFFVFNSKTIENEVNVMFFYESKVAFSSLTLSSLKNNETITAVTLISSAQLENINHEIFVRNINMMNINDNSYFLITYTKNENDNSSSYSRLYNYNIANSINTSFNYMSDLESANNPYLLTSNEYVIYPDENQTIKFSKVSIDGQNNVTKLLSKISNPIITPHYFEEDKFVYVKTNTAAKLLTSPWELNEILTIEANEDLIWIASGEIERENAIIQDFKYCLYTFEGVNYKGYIQSSNLTEKDIISIEDYDYKAFKVLPNTNLYSLPTKVPDDQITNTLRSSVKFQIKENSRLEVIDVLCDYTTMKSKMLKVKVNGNQVGYIERSSIINPSDTVDFVITNSSIKDEKTKVYLEQSPNSDTIYTLNKGYRIRINGSRDTKTGYTSITFNDEYGNEFTGYIITDVISADSWSTLQIVGCILIAINIGLLILIIKFRDEYIGKNGQKYVSSQKSNYSKTTSSNDKNEKDKEIN